MVILNSFLLSPLINLKRAFKNLEMIPCRFYRFRNFENYRLRVKALHHPVSCLFSYILKSGLFLYYKKL